MKAKQNIQNKYTKYLLGIFVIIAIVIFYYILFKYPQTGVADQGDFDRLMWPAGLKLLESDATNPDFIRFYQYIVTDYKIDIKFYNIATTIFGSIIDYIIFIINIICKLLGQSIFKTQYLAIVYGLIYISSIFIIIKNLNINSKLKLLIIYTVAIFIFMDGNYIVWFNSLYGEPMMISSLLLFLASVLIYINSKSKEKIFNKLIFVYIAAFMFIASKMQVLTALPFVLFILIKIFLDNRNYLSKKAKIVLTSILIFTIIHPLQMNAVNKDIKKDTNYNSVFYGILNGSETPRQDLIDLGLNPEMASEAGKHAYLAPEEYKKYVPRTEITEQEFYSKIGNMKLATFYLTHPKRLIEGMEYTAEHAFITSTSLGKYYMADNEDLSLEFNRFTTWSNFRESKLPNKLWFILTIFLLVFIGSLTKYIKSKEDKKIRERITLVWGLIFIAGIQFPMPYVANGQADTAKQLYLFNFIFDIFLFIILIAIIFKAIDFIKNMLLGKK